MPCNNGPGLAGHAPGAGGFPCADLAGLTCALEGPILLALYMPEPPGTAQSSGSLADSWQVLTERVCRL